MVVLSYTQGTFKVNNINKVENHYVRVLLKKIRNPYQLQCPEAFFLPFKNFVAQGLTFNL